jgi:hypothetical protein
MGAKTISVVMGWRERFVSVRPSWASGIEGTGVFLMGDSAPLVDERGESSLMLLGSEESMSVEEGEVELVEEGMVELFSDRVLAGAVGLVQ